MSKESRQKKEVRRAKKALRHAVKRNSSEYVQKRIKLHMDAVAAGKPPPGCPERTANRRVSQEQQHRAAAIKTVAAAAAPVVAPSAEFSPRIKIEQSTPA